MTNNVKILLIFLFCFQLLVGSGFDLAHDEAYYWVFSNHLDWGYFDHPPAVALIIKIFSFLPHSELSVRAGFIILQILTILILFKLIPEDRKLESILLYFAFPLASIAGLFALPDMPLLFMTAVYFWCLREFLDNENLKNSLLLGLVIAILLNTKYHGILLIFFTLLALPSLLRKQKFYLIFLVSLVLFLPHILWQYHHEFATLKYHFFERPKSSFNPQRVFEYLGTQIAIAGVFLGPVVWWTVIKTKVSSNFEKVLKFNALGIIIFFLISSFSKKIEANWTILTAIPLIILTLKSEVWTRRSVRILMLTSFIITLFARMALVIELPIKRSMELHGWKNWSNHVYSQCKFPWLANNYQLASKLSFYLQKPIHALNYQSRKNQFDIWKMDSAYYQSEKVCYLTRSNHFGGKLVLSPEGKELYLVQDRSLKELLKLKSRASLEKP
jgi:4-amino-4-deoxy-L-arabinose transferase-like glycosyltransferase